MSPRDDESVGRVILGRYRVVLPLGRGGQGAVYLARGEGAEGFARPVVVKRILAPLARDPFVLEQFAREARITAQLRHPAIVPIIDFARDRDSHVMVLEYVHGYDLRRWERYVRKVSGHFPPELIVYPMLRVLDALQYAHTLRAADGTPRSVVHRDISPANVLIDVEGHVKLTDFGIARMADEELTQDTSTVKIKGKLPYLAPEMFHGERASERTDLYACGVVLHELLSGKNEFFGSSAVESMARVTGHVPTRLDKVRGDISQALSDLTERALAKDPAARFESAYELSSALRAAFDLDENEIAQRFRSAIMQDFNDPRLAELTGSRTLADLDKAWRTAPNVASLADLARSAPLETVDADHASDPWPATLPSLDVPGMPIPAHPEPAHPSQPIGTASVVQSQPVGTLTVPVAQPRSRHVALWFAGLVALSFIGVRLWRAESASSPRFVYVDKQPARPRGPEAATAAAKAGDDPPAEDGPALTSVAPTPTKALPVGQADLLTQAFARRRASVEGCFAKHSEVVGQSASLLVQFAIDARGRVRSASLVPDSLTSTPFGRCVTRIAGSTRFGPQPQAIVFRIPIRARTLAGKR